MFEAAGGLEDVAIVPLPLEALGAAVNVADQFGVNGLAVDGGQLCLQFHLVAIFDHAPVLGLCLVGADGAVVELPSRAIASPHVGKVYAHIAWAGRSRFAVDARVGLAEAGLAAAGLAVAVRFGDGHRRVADVLIGDAAIAAAREQALAAEPERCRPFLPYGSQVLLVLGMHRSGTSVLTRLCNLLGHQLADDLLPAVDWDNPGGYWESESLVQAHDQLLASCGLHWHSPLPVDFKQLTAAQLHAHRLTLAAHLARHFRPRGRFAIKDPRLCRLLPVWLPLLAELKAQVKAVLPFRHPYEVGLSLQKRTGIPVGRWYLLWLRHVLEAERHSRGLPRCFVDYAQLLAGPGPVMARLLQRLGIAADIDPQALAAIVDRSHHHQHWQSAGADDGLLPDWVRAAYDTLLAWSVLPEPGDAEEARHRAEFDRIADALHLADQLFVPVLRPN